MLVRLATVLFNVLIGLAGLYFILLFARYFMAAIG